MAWIESHGELVNHPKTRKLARHLNVPRWGAVGLLHCLWHWAVAYAHDGDLSGYGDEDIALGAEWEDDPKTFVDALVECGWVDRDGENLSVHDWDEYAGRLIDRRKANAERKRQSRARHADIPDPSEGVTGLPNLTKPNKTKPNQKATPSPAPQDDSFENFWNCYPSRRGSKGSKKNARAVWDRLTPEKREQAVSSLPLYEATANGYAKDAERYLRGEVWEGLEPVAEPENPYPRIADLSL